MANTTTKTYQDGDPLLESDLDNLYENLQPSTANLALATTGSSSGDLLTSNGSNVAPAWSTPDVVAASMTSTGANAIFADINASSSVQVCNDIVLQTVASTATSIFNEITSCVASVANIIVDATTRTVASVATHLGFARSSAIGSGFTTSSATYVDVPGLTCTLTTSGRPVVVSLGAGSGVSPYISATADYGRGQFQRNASVSVGSQFFGTAFSGGLQIRHPVSAFRAVDFASAGTHVYTFQVAQGDTVTSGAVQVAVQIGTRIEAYEL